MYYRVPHHLHHKYPFLVRNLWPRDAAHQCLSLGARVIKGSSGLLVYPYPISIREAIQVPRLAESLNEGCDHRCKEWYTQ